MRIRLLGAVEALPDGTGVGPVPLGGLRLRGLLARLALDAGRPVGAAVLVDDLWGHTPPDSAANALQALVSRLRRTIGAEHVDTVAHGYRLCVDPDAVDALRFGALVAGATDPHTLPVAGLAGLREAIALWQGPALADLADLPFAAPAAARLADRRAVAVEQAARLALQLGDADAELDALATQLAAAPLRESTAALLARGLHAGGRQADALAVLDRTRARLADELGVDPGPELEATRLAVLRGEHAPTPIRAAAGPPPPAAGPATVPAVPNALTSFIGRGGDVERVRSLLTTHRLITLIGPGGAGKTRLATEAVAAVTQRRHIAGLAALTAADQLPAAVLAAVGGPDLVVRPRDEPGTDTTTRLLTTLAAQETVLVLDNCEHLVDGVAALAEMLLQACPRLRVLATSREPLGVPGEVLHPVGALAAADAIRLFADRAAAVAPGFALTPEVGAAVAEICRRLDGQPLPIELAAARLRTLSPAEIASRLDDRFRLLTSGARTALPRHQTLRAVVDWSWELLSEPERAVARRLAAFAGGATAAAAERVCAGAPGPPPDGVFDTLAALVDKSLVVAAPQPGDQATRYRMLETIREYAGERLAESGERDTAIAAHTRLVLDLVETAEPHLRGAEQLEWLATLRAVDDEIDIAMRRAVAAGDAAVAHRIAAGSGWSLLIRGLMEEAIRRFETVHPLDGPVPPQTRALTSTFMTLASVVRGDLDAAEVHIRQAIDIAATLPPPLHPLLALIDPAYQLFVLENPGPVRRLSQAHPDPWVRAFALQVLAQIAENDGEIDELRRLARAAHQLFSQVGDRFGRGMLVFSLGELEDLAGEFDAAESAFDEAIELATELGNLDDLPQFITRRALLEARRGDLEEARKRLAWLAAQPDTQFLVSESPLLAAAYVDRLAGDIDAAQANVELAGERVDVIGFTVPQRRAMVEASRAAVANAAGDTPTVGAALTRAVAAAVESKDGPVSAAIAEVTAIVAFDRGDPAGAAFLLGVAIAQRGTLDLGSREVVAVVDGVRTALGADAADAAVRQGRDLPRPDGMARLGEMIAEMVRKGAARLGP